MLNSEELEAQKLRLELRLAQIEKNEKCQENFLEFVKRMWPSFIAGEHHRIIAEKLERVANGELKRLIINMAPRHTKSEFASFLFPAWMMGRRPDMQIIQATHTTELAVNFGRKVKTSWTVTITKKFSLTRSLPRMPRRLAGGPRAVEGCTTLWVLDRTLRVVVVT